jgi:hypothetical protein
MFARFQTDGASEKISLHAPRLHAEGCVPGQSRKIEGVEERLEYVPNDGGSALAVQRTLRSTRNVFAVRFRVTTSSWKLHFVCAPSFGFAGGNWMG